MFQRLRGRRSLVVLAALLSIVGAAAPGPAMAATQVIFEFAIDSCWLEGRHAPPNKPFFVELLRSDGVSKGKLAVASDSAGYWSVNDCFEDDIVPGDRIKATNLGDYNRALVVPNVWVRSDRAKNRLWGKAPAGSSIFASVDACALYSWQSCNTGEASETAAGNGSFNLTPAEFTPKVNPRGGDSWWVDIDLPSGDRISVEGRFAIMQVGSNGRFWVMNVPRTLGSLELRNSSGTPRATAPFLGSDDPWGEDSGLFRLPNGNRAYPAAAETVWGSFASDALLPVPPGPFTATASTDTVSGKCYPNQAVYVTAFDPRWNREESWSDRSGKADASGNFALKMKYANYPAFDLMSGDRVNVVCRHLSGDEYLNWFRVP